MRRPAAVLLAVTLVAGGCTAEPEPPRQQEVTWQPGALPVPAGRTAVVRDVTACPNDKTWFAVGATRDGQGGTAPAAWTSPDADTWTSLRIDARSYYGKQNVLATVACRDGRVAAVGAKSGGAHAYPRTFSWHQTADGVLHEVAAPFDLFGGQNAVNVGRLDAGPGGFLISGNRMSGAAVWRSPDAAEFAIVERAPVLASDATGETWAFDSVATGDGWLLVGGFLPKGRIDRDPMAWRSADGVAWARVPGPATDAYEEIQRVALAGAVPVGVGVAGGTFGAWRLTGGAWQAAGTFGVAGAGPGTTVRSVAASGDQVYATTGSPDAYALWVSPDGGASWRPGDLPSVVPARSETAAAVAVAGGRVVLVTDDGTDGRIYTAETGT